MSSILSLTFHTPYHLCSQWDEFVRNELSQMVENLLDVEKYIISEVQSDMLREGKNTNLLVLFDDAAKRTGFVEIELLNITEIIEAEFGQDVMIFTTFLNPLTARF